MNHSELIAAALSIGFSSAFVIDTKALVLNPAFRQDCEENYCGNYGKNYSCPPDCGSAADMGQKLLSRPQALLLVSVWDIPDWRDESRLRQVRRRHNEDAAKLMAQFPSGQWLYAGASGCLLCDTCARAQGQPCRFPEKRYSCLSAYCVDVSRLAAYCGVEYFRKDGKLSFFSLSAF